MLVAIFPTIFAFWRQLSGCILGAGIPDTFHFNDLFEFSFPSLLYLLDYFFFLLVCRMACSHFDTRAQKSSKNRTVDEDEGGANPERELIPPCGPAGLQNLTFQFEGHFKFSGNHRAKVLVFRLLPPGWVGNHNQRRTPEQSASFLNSKGENDPDVSDAVIRCKDARLRMD